MAREIIPGYASDEYKGQKHTTHVACYEEKTEKKPRGNREETERNPRGNQKEPNRMKPQGN
jgi:hypothetical protein